MSIIGLRSTADFTVDGQRPKNWREGILALYPNGGATLTALTALMETRSVDDPEYNWYERELTDRRFVLASNITDGVQTALTFTTARDVRELKAGDMLRVEQTGEIVKVASDPTSATALTVSRGFAGSTPAAVLFAGAGVNPNLLAMGSAYEEGSLAPSGVQLDPVKKYNYTQIFRQTLEFTRTAIKTRLRTGDQVKQAKKDALEMLSMDMERGFLLGKRSESTQNGKPIRTSDGIEARLLADAPANIVTAGATTNMEQLEVMLKNAFQYGSDEKLGFIGNDALLVIQQIVRKNSTYQIQGGLKEYGMNVMRLTTPFGELVLKRHTLFNNNTGGTTTAVAYYGMASWLMILDTKELIYTHLKGSDIEYESKLQTNGLDGEKSGYLGECSIEIHHAKTHFLIKALKAPAIDP